MFGKSSKKSDAYGSFLPTDYIERKAERRTLVLTVTLFCCVMGGVVAAFFVTNREWNDVRTYQNAINVRFAQAAQDIELLKTLEERKIDLLEKAEVTQALIERVPRSILFAELINRMPPRMTLTELNIDSERRERKITRSSADDDEADTKKKKSSSRRGRSLSGRTTDEPEVREVTAPEYLTSLEIVGVAPVHEEVASYVSQLQLCPLLSSVELVRTQRKKIEDRELHEFTIRATLDADADAREITPLAHSRDGSSDSPSSSLLDSIFSLTSGVPLGSGEGGQP